MMDFLIDVRSNEADTAHVRFGFELATRFGAHLTGLQVIAVDASLIALPEPLLILEDEEAFAHGRHAWWAKICRDHGVDGAWEVRRGVHRRILIRRASFASLLIGRLHSTGSGNPFGTGILARVVLARVAPVILVPDQSAPSALRSILLTWNGSAVSMRAIRAALPFMARARHITILAGDRHSRVRRGDADALLRNWLQRNSVVCDWIEMDDGVSPGETICRIADEVRAEGIVMGAWGRSRLRELALGGTTRHLLSHSKVPLLISA